MVCEEDQHTKPCQKPWLIKGYSSSSPRPVKSRGNSIRYNCQKLCSWLRRPKTILEIRKKSTFSWWSTILLFISFSKTCHRKKNNRALVGFVVDFSPTCLNTGTTHETFQQSGKQDSCRQILKSSASTLESSGSPLFRTTTGRQLGRGVFDDSRFVLTFLTILGVTEICSFRLVLEVKTGKETPESSRLELLEKIQQTLLVYQTQKATPLGHWIEEVYQIYLCWKHY